MPTFGWLTLILLSILGGLIAWAGDVIGYRLGKSRRSLFGLRPRTTARLVGIVVGALLPLVGVGAALVASSDARDAMFHLKALRDDAAALQTKNEQLRSEAGRLETQTKRAEASASRSGREAIEYRGYLDRAKENLSAAKVQVAQTNERLGAAQRLLGEAQQKVAQQGVIRKGLDERIREVRGRLDEADRKLAEAGKKLEDTKADLANADAELKLRREQLAGARADVQVLLNSPVALESGRLLARVVLEVGGTLAETEDRLLKLLLVASDSARKLGAERAGGVLAVQLIRPAPPELELKPGEFPAETEVLHYFASQLQEAGKRKFVVDVRVARRMYEAEVAPVGVELYARPYVRVFLENDLVTSVLVDGSKDRDEVFRQLMGLYREIVRTEALHRGLIPDPDTNLVGDIPPDFLTALDEIVAAKQIVRVKVVAAADTYITDQLLTRIEVEKAEPREPAGPGD